jgi:hypothetical protein
MIGHVSSLKCKEGSPKLLTATPRIDTAVLEQFRFAREGVYLTSKPHLPGSLPGERPHTRRFRY